ncbi:hypothetical protein GCM10010172_19430 [Paractinoplanes ferrugineus]|uniref:HTH marR-type domain-containing protein n=2 Tax=Paractinoplanes ferrugineus TaxID=113564 RepID=A0A919J7E7_9ACTN|nr:hypothetical protein Afe05nite_80660 [Actinoplanes ferrugineus]
MRSAVPAGADPRDFVILGVLMSGEGMSQQEVADRLNINRTAMVKLLDRLESIGHVVRRRNVNDRRSYILTLTPAGRAAVQAWEPLVAAGEAALTAPLLPEERQRLNDLLRRLLPALDAWLPHLPSQRTGYLLIHADLRLRRHAEYELSRIGLQQRHFAALATLAQIGRPCTQQELAQRLDAHDAAMVPVLDDLEARRLCERRRDRRDRRRYALRLTEEGQAALRAAQVVMRAVNEGVVALLAADGERELRRLLTKLG